MPRSSRRLGPSLLCAALLLAAGCGGVPDPNSAAVDPPDLYQALPTPSSPPELVPTTAPPVSAAPTTTARPTPTSTSQARPRGGAAGGPAGVGGAAQAEATPRIDWQPAGGDEFDGPALDEAAWNTYEGVGSFGNGTRNPEIISQSDGLLRIAARGDDNGGMGHRYGQLYGRWEFRARTSPGRGFGSAILLWPDSENFPIDGELDIMEVPRENRDLAHFVIHWGAENNTIGSNVPGDFTQWHTFAIEWLPDRITWFVDGVQRYENTDLAVIPTKSMHLTIQLDQGPVKDWLPPRDETTPEEVLLEVDWVRIYQAPPPPGP